MDMGVGHSGLVKMCRFMNMPEMHHKTYAKHVRAITEANMVVVNTVLDEAAVTVRKACQDLDPTITEDSILDLTASFDGSWMTRGHKSLYGVGCVVEVTTGLVLDLAVLSLYCQRCTYAEKLFGGTQRRTLNATRTATALLGEWKTLLQKSFGIVLSSVATGTRR